MTISSPSPASKPTSNKPPIIRPARSQSDLTALSHLFRSYALSLDIDLSFQAFDTELQFLPGTYTPEKRGEVLLAFPPCSSNDESPTTAIGCVALRALDGGEEERGCCCEMKRLYVAPEGRGLGVGEELTGAIIRVAREREYRVMKLDTLPTMRAARALYRKLGFVETEAYYETPIAGTVFLAKNLETEWDT
ncbi:MAG: hypothetical protein Q9184_005517 [Pyrenodesmia sp. 2 TL-2023]